MTHRTWPGLPLRSGRLRPRPRALTSAPPALPGTPSRGRAGVPPVTALPRSCRSSGGPQLRPGVPPPPRSLLSAAVPPGNAGVPRREAAAQPGAAPGGLTGSSPLPRDGPRSLRRQHRQEQGTAHRVRDGLGNRAGTAPGPGAHRGRNGAERDGTGEQDQPLWPPLAPPPPGPWRGRRDEPPLSIDLTFHLLRHLLLLARAQSQRARADSNRRILDAVGR
ncbi:urocortin [Passer montanus]|uniref:urocortin n=1 Tax=Passer montanus TaxID=9160 RepID=UPI00195FE28C|nr:urocortin [Passer montanus]